MLSSEKNFNFSEWSNIQTTEWLNGLDEKLHQYIPALSQLNGKEILQLSLPSSSLDRYGIFKLGHQDALKDALRHLSAFNSNSFLEKKFAFTNFQFSQSVQEIYQFTQFSWKPGPFFFQSSTNRGQPRNHKRNRFDPSKRKTCIVFSRQNNFFKPCFNKPDSRNSTRKKSVDNSFHSFDHHGAAINVHLHTRRKH